MTKTEFARNYVEAVNKDIKLAGEAPQQYGLLCGVNCHVESTNLLVRAGLKPNDVLAYKSKLDLGISPGFGRPLPGLETRAIAGNAVAPEATAVTSVSARPSVPESIPGNGLGRPTGPALAPETGVGSGAPARGTFDSNKQVVLKITEPLPWDTRAVPTSIEASPQVNRGLSLMKEYLDRPVVKDPFVKDAARDAFHYSIINNESVNALYANNKLRLNTMTNAFNGAEDVLVARARAGENVEGLLAKHDSLIQQTRDIWKNTQPNITEKIQFVRQELDPFLRDVFDSTVAKYDSAVASKPFVPEKATLAPETGAGTGGGDAALADRIAAQIEARNAGGGAAPPISVAERGAIERVNKLTESYFDKGLFRNEVPRRDIEAYSAKVWDADQQLKAAGLDRVRPFDSNSTVIIRSSDGTIVAKPSINRAGYFEVPSSDATLAKIDRTYTSSIAPERPVVSPGVLSSELRPVTMAIARSELESMLPSKLNLDRRSLTQAGGAFLQVFQSSPVAAEVPKLPTFAHVQTLGAGELRGFRSVSLDTRVPRAGSELMTPGGERLPFVKDANGAWTLREPQGAPGIAASAPAGRIPSSPITPFFALGGANALNPTPSSAAQAPAPTIDRTDLTIDQSAKTPQLPRRPADLSTLAGSGGVRETLPPPDRPADIQSVKPSVSLLLAGVGIRAGTPQSGEPSSPSPIAWNPPGVPNPVPGIPSVSDATRARFVQNALTQGDRLLKEAEALDRSIQAANGPDYFKRLSADRVAEIKKNLSAIAQGTQSPSLDAATVRAVTDTQGILSDVLGKEAQGFNMFAANHFNAAVSKANSSYLLWPAAAYDTFVGVVDGSIGGVLWSVDRLGTMIGVPGFGNPASTLKDAIDPYGGAVQNILAVSSAYPFVQPTINTTVRTAVKAAIPESVGTMLSRNPVVPTTREASWIKESKPVSPTITPNAADDALGVTAARASAAEKTGGKVQFFDVGSNPDPEHFASSGALPLNRQVLIDVVAGELDKYPGIFWERNVPIRIGDFAYGPKLKNVYLPGLNARTEEKIPLLGHGGAFDEPTIGNSNGFALAFQDTFETRLPAIVDGAGFMWIDPTLSPSRMRSVFHHELQHINDRFFANDKSWMEAVYGPGDQSLYYGKLNPDPKNPFTPTPSRKPGFVDNGYAYNGGPVEDKAVLAQAMFENYPEVARAAATDPILFKKMALIKRGYFIASDGAMDDVYWKNLKPIYPEMRLLPVEGQIVNPADWAYPHYFEPVIDVGVTSRIIQSAPAIPSGAVDESADKADLPAGAVSKTLPTGAPIPVIEIQTDGTSRILPPAPAPQPGSQASQQTPTTPQTSPISSTESVKTLAALSYSAPSTPVGRGQSALQDAADLFSLYPAITGSVLVSPAEARLRTPINPDRQATSIAELYWVTQALAHMYGIPDADIPGIAAAIAGVYSQEASLNPDVWNRLTSVFAGPSQTSKERVAENVAFLRFAAQSPYLNLSAQDRKVFTDLANRLDALSAAGLDTRKDLYTGIAQLAVQMFTLDPQGAATNLPGTGAGFSTALVAAKVALNPDGTINPQVAAAVMQTGQICPDCILAYSQDPNATLTPTWAGYLNSKHNLVDVKAGDLVSKSFDKMLTSKKNYATNFTRGINQMNQYLYGGQPIASSEAPNPVGPISFMTTVEGVLRDASDAARKIVAGNVAPQPTRTTQGTVPIPPIRPAPAESTFMNSVLHPFDTLSNIGSFLTSPFRSTVQQGAVPVGCAGGTCVRLDVPCKNAASCYVSSLDNFPENLKNLFTTVNIEGFRVTEAMKNTRPHKALSERIELSVDAGKAGGMTADEIARVIVAAEANGLRPVYEVQTARQKNSLVQAGIPSRSIAVVGGWITGPHFSIYDRAGSGTQIATAPTVPTPPSRPSQQTIDELADVAPAATPIDVATVFPPIPVMEPEVVASPAVPKQPVQPLAFSNLQLGVFNGARGQFLAQLESPDVLPEPIPVDIPSFIPNPPIIIEPEVLQPVYANVPVPPSRPTADLAALAQAEKEAIAAQAKVQAVAEARQLAEAQAQAAKAARAQIAAEDALARAQKINENLAQAQEQVAQLAREKIAAEDALVQMQKTVNENLARIQEQVAQAQRAQIAAEDVQEARDLAAARDQAASAEYDRLEALAQAQRQRLADAQAKAAQGVADEARAAQAKAEAQRLADAERELKAAEEAKASAKAQSDAAIREYDRLAAEFQARALARAYAGSLYAQAQNQTAPTTASLAQLDPYFANGLRLNAPAVAATPDLLTGKQLASNPAVPQTNPGIGGTVVPSAPIQPKEAPVELAALSDPFANKRLIAAAPGLNAVQPSFLPTYTSIPKVSTTFTQSPRAYSFNGFMTVTPSDFETGRVAINEPQVLTPPITDTAPAATVEEPAYNPPAPLIIEPEQVPVQTANVPLPPERPSSIGLVEAPKAVVDINRTLRLGSTGEDVSHWQELLLSKGFGAGMPLDGIYGPQTAKATADFQRSVGITADGIFGPETRAVLREESTAPATPAPAVNATESYYLTPDGSFEETPAGALQTMKDLQGSIGRSSANAQSSYKEGDIRDAITNVHNGINKAETSAEEALVVARATGNQALADAAEALKAKVRGVQDRFSSTLDAALKTKTGVTPELTTILSEGKTLSDLLKDVQNLTVQAQETLSKASQATPSLTPGQKFWKWLTTPSQWLNPNGPALGSEAPLPPRRPTDISSTPSLTETEPQTVSPRQQAYRYLRATQSNPDTFITKLELANLYNLSHIDPEKLAKFLPDAPPDYPVALPPHAYLPRNLFINEIEKEQSYASIKEVADKVNVFLANEAAKRGVAMDPIEVVPYSSSDSDEMQTLGIPRGKHGSGYDPLSKKVYIDRHESFNQAGKWALEDIPALRAKVAHEMGHAFADRVRVVPTAFDAAWRDKTASVFYLSGKTDQPAGAYVEQQADYFAGVFLRATDLLQQGDPMRIYYSFAAMGDDYTTTAHQFSDEATTNWLRSNETHGLGKDRAKAIYDGMLPTGNLDTGLKFLGTTPDWNALPKLSGATKSGETVSPTPATPQVAPAPAANPNRTFLEKVKDYFSNTPVLDILFSASKPQAAEVTGASAPVTEATSVIDLVMQEAAREQFAQQDAAYQAQQANRSIGEQVRDALSIGGAWASTPVHVVEQTTVDIAAQRYIAEDDMACRAAGFTPVWKCTLAATGIHAIESDFKTGQAGTADTAGSNGLGQVTAGTAPYVYNQLIKNPGFGKQFSYIKNFNDFSRALGGDDWRLNGPWATIAGHFPLGDYGTNLDDMNTLQAVLHRYNPSSTYPGAVINNMNKLMRGEVPTKQSGRPSDEWRAVAIAAQQYIANGGTIPAAWSQGVLVARAPADLMAAAQARASGQFAAAQRRQDWTLALAAQGVQVDNTAYRPGGVQPAPAVVSPTPTVDPALVQKKTALESAERTMINMQARAKQEGIWADEAAAKEIYLDTQPGKYDGALSHTLAALNAGNALMREVVKIASMTGDRVLAGKASDVIDASQGFISRINRGIQDPGLLNANLASLSDLKEKLPKLAQTGEALATQAQQFADKELASIDQKIAEAQKVAQATPQWTAPVKMPESTWKEEGASETQGSPSFFGQPQTTAQKSRILIWPGVRNINPIIYTLMEEAVKHLPPGYTIRIVSAARDRSTVGADSYHVKRLADLPPNLASALRAAGVSDDHGLAVDISIVTPQGESLRNIRAPENFRLYREFMQNVKAAQDRLYPQFRNFGRWGGYFVQGVAQDLMHYDLGPSTNMAAGSWERGLMSQYVFYASDRSEVGRGMSAPYQIASAPGAPTTPDTQVASNPRGPVDWVTIGGNSAQAVPTAPEGVKVLKVGSPVPTTAQPGITAVAHDPTTGRTYVCSLPVEQCQVVLPQAINADRVAAGYVADTTISAATPGSSEIPSTVGKPATAPPPPTAYGFASLGNLPERTDPLFKKPLKEISFEDKKAAIIKAFDAITDMWQQTLASVGISYRKPVLTVRHIVTITDPRTGETYESGSRAMNPNPQNPTGSIDIGVDTSSMPEGATLIDLIMMMSHEAGHTAEYAMGVRGEADGVAPNASMKQVEHVADILGARGMLAKYPDGTPILAAGDVEHLQRGMASTPTHGGHDPHGTGEERAELFKRGFAVSNDISALFKSVGLQPRQNIASISVTPPVAPVPKFVVEDYIGEVKVLPQTEAEAPKPDWNATTAKAPDTVAQEASVTPEVSMTAQKPAQIAPANLFDQITQITRQLMPLGNVLAVLMQLSLRNRKTGTLTQPPVQQQTAGDGVPPPTPEEQAQRIAQIDADIADLARQQQLAEIAVVEENGGQAAFEAFDPAERVRLIQSDATFADLTERISALSEEANALASGEVLATEGTALVTTATDVAQGGFNAVLRRETPLDLISQRGGLKVALRDTFFSSPKTKLAVVGGTLGGTWAISSLIGGIGGGSPSTPADAAAGGAGVVGTKPGDASTLGDASGKPLPTYIASPAHLAPPAAPGTTPPGGAPIPRPQWDPTPGGNPSYPGMPSYTGYPDQSGYGYPMSPWQQQQMQQQAMQQQQAQQQKMQQQAQQQQALQNLLRQQQQQQAQQAAQQKNTTPPTIQFSASPSTVTLFASTTLQWTSTNTTACYIFDPAGKLVTQGTQNGSYPIAAVTQTTTYGMTCTSYSYGQNTYATTTVMVATSTQSSGL